MILFTVGTNEQPFDRLVSAAAALDLGEPLLVQYGASLITRGRGEWVDFLSFEELADRMRDARVVVCHAGVGSMMLARRCGRCPIVVPRRLHLHEAVDDHQLPLARRMDAAGVATLVEDVADLPLAIGASSHDAGVAARSGVVGLPGAQSLSTELRTLFSGLGADERRAA